MKPVFLALLVAITFLTPAAAAEIGATSRVDVVTVYPQGAEITRVATIKIPAGEHSLILDGLPGDVDPQSIRVEGDVGGAIEIRSIDSNLVHVTDEEDLASQREQIEGDIELLQDEIAAFDQQAHNIAYRRKLIKGVANRPLTTGASSETVVKVDSTDLENLLDLVARRLQTLDENSLKVSVKKRKVSDRINDLMIKLSELSPKDVTRTTVSVDLLSRTETSAVFKIRYRIANAGWQPYYDARLNSSVDDTEADTKPMLSLIRRAQIRQTTTEDWNNVALVLSTARPVGMTSAPGLSPFELQYRRHQYSRLGKSAPRKKEMDSSLAELESVDESKSKLQGTPEPTLPAEEVAANVSVAGFQALYVIPGRLSVDNRGTAKRVKISDDALEVALSANAVPVLDPNAYLMAKFTLGGDSPVLPGRVLLYRDNVFMGNGYLPLLVPGEDHELGFGVDDNIKIIRNEVLHKTGESGVISTSLVEEKSWSTEVKNFHASTVPVKIFDRMPYAVDKDIDVELLSGITPPGEKNVEKKRGVMEWSINLAAGETQTIKFGYRISRPKDLLN